MNDSEIDEVHIETSSKYSLVVKKIEKNDWSIFTTVQEDFLHFFL